MDRNHVYNLLKNGSYSLIESEMFIDLSGFNSLKIKGCYRGEISENSYIVEKPENISVEDFTKIMIDLAIKHEQESIIISDHNHVKLIFTSGSIYSGFGYSEKCGENYSIIEFEDGKDPIIIGEYNLKKD